MHALMSAFIVTVAGTIIVAIVVAIALRWLR